MTLYRFHVSIHARPKSVPPAKAVLIAGAPLSILDVSAASQSAPLPPSFEAAAEALSRLPRLHLELDGSFVWRADSGEPSWQVDGNLYDREGHLVSVVLKGCCPEDRFDALVRCTCESPTPLMFQLVQEAVFVDENEFRRCARQRGTSLPGEAY